MAHQELTQKLDGAVGRSAGKADGAKTQIVSPKNGRVRAWKFTDRGIKLPVDIKLIDAQAEDFDALLLPGGVINPDTLRIDQKAVAFVKAFFDNGKPVANLDGPSSRPARRAGESPMAFAEDRSQERRRRLGRPAGRRRQGVGDEPQSG